MNIKRIGKPMYVYDYVTSTFDKAAEFEPSHGLTVVAKRQSDGRGRLGRQWQSDEGGLYMSIYLATDASMQSCGNVTMLCAVAVANALSHYGNCQIKWPNDIVMNGKKVCGILAKSCIQKGKADFACVGIGINANIAYFPQELQHASSLMLETGEKCDEEMLLGQVLQSIQATYELSHNELMQSYRKLCITLNSQVAVHYTDGNTLQGVCTDISDNGELVVTTQDKSITVNSGEVSVRGLYGYV